MRVLTTALFIAVLMASVNSFGCGNEHLEKKPDESAQVQPKPEAPKAEEKAAQIESIEALPLVDESLLQPAMAGFVTSKIPE